MKKYIINIQIILTFIISTNVTAQQVECYKEFSTQTTYNNPWDWEFSTTQNSASLWDMNPSGTYSPVVQYHNTPFHNTTGNPNLFNLGVPSIKDYQKEDGWELIKQDFGIGGAPVANPIVIFYNKYQSKLRVFVLITQQYSNDNSVNGSVVGGYIKIFYRNMPGSGVNERATANLSLTNETAVALDAWNKNSSFTAPNLFANSLPFWMYADYTMQYDPCVCYFDEDFPVFRIEVVVHNSSTISIDLRGTIENVVGTPGVINKTHNSAFGEILSQIDGVKKFYSTGNELVNEFGNSAADLANGETKTQILGALTELGEFASFVKIIPKYGVFVNKGLKLTNFLLTGGKKENKDITASNTFNREKVNVSGTGTINTTSYKRFSEFYVPGVKNDPNKDPQYYPDYNNTLGIINLLETPELETRDIEFDFPSSCPDIREYHLKKDIIYVLNAATELNIQDHEHIQASFLIKTHKGIGAGCLPTKNQNGVVFPIEFSNKSLEFNAAINGYEVVSNSTTSEITFRTPFLPLNCLGGITFQTYVNPDPSNQVEVFLQLKLALKRTDADATPETQDVLYIVTYKVNQTPISEPAGTYEFTGVSSTSFETLNLPFTPNGSVAAWVASYSVPSPWTNSLSNVLVNPVFSSGDIIDGNLKALGKIFITDGVNIVSGSVLEATNEIEVTTTNDYFPNVDFKLLDFGSFCSEKLVTDFEATEQQIKSFCQSSTYTSLSSFSKKENEEETSNPFEKEGELVVYPNPASTSFAIDFELEENREVQISVVDISGKVILTPLAKTRLNAGSFHYLVNSSTLTSGIYFINVEKDGVLFTEKLIIAK